MEAQAAVRLEETALDFAAAGCSVIPTRTDASKAPAAFWKPYQSQRAGPDQIRAWLTDGDHDGIGVVTGTVSGGLEMLEFEGRAITEKALEAYAGHLSDHGLAELWTRITAGYLEMTPTGGLHILYRVDGEQRGNTKLARRPATDDELTAEERRIAAARPGKAFTRVLMETRGEGGFVVVAPSAGRTHPSGGAWSLLAGKPGSIATITEDERDALHAIASLLDTMPTADLFPDTAKKPGQPPSRSQESVEQRPGDDYNERADWADILRPHGWTHVADYGTGRAWRRPDKNRGISATTGTRDGDNLYVFSSSTEFEVETPYSKFGAYCVAPETKVLRSDLTWAEAGSLAVGDGLVGVDEEIDRKGGRRKLRLSHVESIERRVLPCYRITLADGRTVTASDEHPWLAASAGGGGNMRWIETNNLRPGQRICSLTTGTWETATDFDSGWLSGMFDGEGWASCGVVGMSQCPGPVLDRAERLLLERGFGFANRASSSGTAHNLTIASLPEILRLLGTLQPERLVAKRQWVGRGAWTQAAPNALVVSVEFVGELETAAFMTTTRTFVAEGLVSHNTLLEHRGDYAAAARELRRQGYGAPMRHDDEDLHELIADYRPEVHGSLATVTELRPAAEPRLQVVDERTHRYSDDRNALALIDRFGEDIRYCPDRGKWLAWAGTHWQWSEAGGGIVREYAKRIARSLPETEKEDARYKQSSLSGRGVSSAIMLAQTDGRIVVAMNDLDAHPFELNTPGGRVDLRSGELLSADPGRLHTRLTRLAPDAQMPTPRWSEFLADTFDSDTEMIAFVQRLAGYSASADVRHHILPFPHGGGQNGKSVLMDTLRSLLGDYATTAPPGFLMEGKHEHASEVARLQGLRLVVASEVNQTSRFDEAKLKELTGGDTLTARFMRQDFFTFQPTHHLWLMANHKPQVKAGGDSFWRRLRLIPFNHRVPDEKKIGNLSTLLVSEEGPGILAWIVAGAVNVFSNGLREPESVMAETRAYAQEEDQLGRFLEECCHVGGGTQVQVETKVLRAAYERWCHSEGEQPLTSSPLGRELKLYGIALAKSNNKRFYTNLALISTEDDRWGDQ